MVIFVISYYCDIGYSVIGHVCCLSLLGMCVIGYSVIGHVCCLFLSDMFMIGCNEMIICDVCLH